MITMKPETRCKHLARDIGPLAKHIAGGFSPAVDRISLERQDWELLHENPQVARVHGFTVLADRIAYQGIEVVPRPDPVHTDR